MNTINLFRIENEEGFGVYQSYAKDSNINVWEKVSGSQIDNRMQPPPYNKILNYNENRRSMFFGFSSIDQLRNWFYNDYWLIEFEKLGFHLSVYNVDLKNCQRDQYQAIFDKKKASLIKKISLKELVKNKFII